MTPDERQALITSYGQAYALLIDALRQFPREMWQFRSQLDPWTIHEIIIHITDSETNSYIRCRRCIAEPGSTVSDYDENRWARHLTYHKQSPDDALILFRGLRSSTHALLRQLEESAWSQQIIHPENGTMTLEDWLRVYERHIPEHIAQMQRIYEDWSQRHSPLTVSS